MFNLIQISFDFVSLLPFQSSFLNMNVLGDDYVSFTAMDINISPNGSYILVSTGQLPIVLDRN